jgi:four helix bundle protein
MDFQRMRVYGACEALTAEIDRLLPRAYASAPRPADHLERSADSVLFNTAEAVASYRPKMKVAAYEIARKEASEVRAVLRRLVQKQVFTRPEIDKAYSLAGVCIAMLTNTIFAQEKRE